MLPESVIVPDFPVEEEEIFSCAVEGYSVSVGRNAPGCERLVSSHKDVHPKCLWLHALKAVGSHVILCLGDKESVPYEILKQVGKIALENSQSRELGVRFSVLEFVFKPEGAPPGVWWSSRSRKFSI